MSTATTPSPSLHWAHRAEPAPALRALVGEEYRPAFVYWPAQDDEPERWEWIDSGGRVRLMTADQVRKQFNHWAERYGADVCQSAAIVHYAGGPEIYGHPAHYPEQYRPQPPKKA